MVLALESISINRINIIRIQVTSYFLSNFSEFSTYKLWINLVGLTRCMRFPKAVLKA